MSLLRIYLNIQEARQTVLRRLPPDETPPAQVREGLKRIFGEAIAPEEAVRRILADVRARGRPGRARLDGAH